MKMKPTIHESLSFINDFFAEIGYNLANQLPDINYLHSLDIQSQSTVSSIGILNTDPDEITTIINSLKMDSATGIDNIPNRFIKMASTLLAPIISHLSNMCLKKGVFPVLLKRSIIHPIVSVISIITVQYLFLRLYQKILKK